jgi:hypothetical protein
VKIHIIVLTALVTLAMLVTGCTVSGSTPASSPAGTKTTPAAQQAKTGTVQMWVTDAPRTDNISEIWVTVTDVKIHEAVAAQVSGNVSGEAEGEVDDSTDSNGWITVNMTGPNRFDLLTLRGENGGLQQILATANLTTGQYTQIRMTVGKVEVNIGGVLKDGVIPSGKLKFVHPFSVQADSVTKLLFDFDADKFVNVTGNPKDPKIMVKPVVKLIVSSPKPANNGANKVKITTPNLPNGTVGQSYNVTLSASGGTPPYTWNLIAGNSTSELTLSTTGILSGTPETGSAGTYLLGVEVLDSSSPVNSDTRQYNLTILEQ